MRRNPIALFALVMSSAPAYGQGVEYIKAHYTKFEYRIPVRDGVKLFTAVYVPKDDSHTYPFLLMRTPYSVAPTVPTATPRTRARLRSSPRRGTSSSTRTCADA